MSDMTAEMEHPVTYDNPVDEALAKLTALYPEHVIADSRPGYSGLVVAPDKLVEVATTLRDELGVEPSVVKRIVPPLGLVPPTDVTLMGSVKTPGAGLR